MAHTFLVSDLPISERFRAPDSKPWHEDAQVKATLEGKTLHATAGATVGGSSPLFNAVSYAFNIHLPLVLTPDAVWLTILLGLTHHIDSEPEKFRHHFVSHDGKKELTVKLAGSLSTPWIWASAIRGFSEQLRENLNPKRLELIVSSFSTTSEIDRLASEVILMGAMKSFFTYKVELACGICRVTVEGTPEDWANIVRRVEALTEFDLGWWTTPLLPVLQQLQAACAGRPDLDFWKRAYLRHARGSGGQYAVSGWINAFHPYVAGRGGMQRNPHVAWEASKGHAGLDPADFPLGLAAVPVKVNDNGTSHECKFYGGLVGVTMGEGYEVKPVSGYSVQLLGGVG